MITKDYKNEDTENLRDEAGELTEEIEKIRLQLSKDQIEKAGVMSGSIRRGTL